MVWGIDSAALADRTLYNCVVQNFGKPSYWGRYLTTVQGASEGLTKEEISFLHEKGVKVLPIYNVFRKAVGYSQGRVAARNAIFHARRLGIPESTVLMANVERFFEVDADWIAGWVDAIYPSGYFPGFYFDPIEGDFSDQFCLASKLNENVKEQSILWSAEQETGVTKKTKAPTFSPKKPNCQANVLLWQYGRDADKCPIDTNVGQKKIMNYLF